LRVLELGVKKVAKGGMREWEGLEGWRPGREIVGYLCMCVWGYVCAYAWSSPCQIIGSLESRVDFVMIAKVVRVEAAWGLSWACHPGSKESQLVGKLQGVP
jgi:hypothetical protein